MWSSFDVLLGIGFMVAWAFAFVVGGVALAVAYGIVVHIRATVTPSEQAPR